ncbi:GAP family protein [Nocardioides sp. YIM 152588]|uniref:GAP family protein n=1 Tax=Nocardioides sp. YIM 152588 TaxID=3158259 RepID=UPI0032E4E10C
MVPEIVLLALASTVRPTSLAAVSALLTREARRPLMIAYVVGGLAFTIAFGVVVVSAFHGLQVQRHVSGARGVVDAVAGVLVLLFGLALHLGVGRGGRSGDPSPAEPQGPGAGWFDREIGATTAAAAGALTHIPGVFYLVALNVIVAHDPRLPGGLIAVAIYDVIWFAVPIAALTLCITDPGMAQRLILGVQEGMRRHGRTILVAACYVVGAALLVRGLLAV